jgi:hypothetical protein
LYSLHKISVSSILIFTCLTAPGDDLFRPSAGAAEAGMGYACVTRDIFWSSFHNQASLAYNSSVRFGINYENRFCIRELGTRFAAITLPAGKASMGAVYSDFGYTDFKRRMAALACGIKLSRNISAGVQADYFSEKASSGLSRIFVTCEAGLIITPSANTRIGIHVFNPLPNSLRKRFIPSRIRIGAGTNLNRLLFTGVEAEMSTGSRITIRSGFEYEAASGFRIRGGFITNNNSFCFGLGYLFRLMQADISFVTHDRLGITSSASLIFKIR